MCTVMCPMVTRAYDYWLHMETTRAWQANRWGGLEADPEDRRAEPSHTRSLDTFATRSSLTTPGLDANGGHPGDIDDSSRGHQCPWHGVTVYARKDARMHDSERTSYDVTRAHKQAVSTPLNELVSALQARLSRRITAYIAGVDNAKTVTRWASGEVTVVRNHEVEQRLRTAYEVFLLLMNYESANTVKAWFIGLNPQLGDIAPIDALREGRLTETVAAARSFTIGG
jgi:hypothetical protein